VNEKLKILLNCIQSKFKMFLTKQILHGHEFYARLSLSCLMWVVFKDQKNLCHQFSFFLTTKHLIATKFILFITIDTISLLLQLLMVYIFIFSLIILYIY
jgi:hypothetical protein